MDINLDKEEHRTLLLDALRAKRLDARKEDTDGGFCLVEVEVLPDNGDEALSVTASGIDQSCEIGLSGYRTVGTSLIECGSAEFVHAQRLEQAVDAFQKYWNLRDRLVADLRAGKYDLP